LRQRKTAYTFDYPQAIEFAETQQRILWTAEEIEMEKDLHDLKTNLDEAELHGVMTVLKLFTQYELNVGMDYWTNRVAKAFPRPDIERMANMFAYVEINVHAPFYAKINELLGVATDEFFESYKENKVLKERIDWIGNVVGARMDNNLDILRSLGAFSMIEGAVLYSNFAFLKHFQAEGKNRLANLVAGINFSVKDENIHAEADAWLFRTLMREASLTKAEQDKLREDMEKVARKTYEHEHEIVKMIFEKGNIRGITANQLDNFVQSRIDLCLENLGYESIFNPTYNPIQKWFYKNINSTKLHDFFAAQGSDYTRAWKETAFVWETDGE
jgi:ribonucleotide reductase beta subunit family protein with ferritin-like domain